MPFFDKPQLKPDHWEMLVLSVLAEGQAYGYAISKAVAARSDNTLSLAPSQLYPLLKRLEKQGLVSASWEEVKAEGADPEADGRRRKWYTLSAKGRKRLTQRIEAHRRFNAIIESFIGGAGGGAPDTRTGAAS
ncbi:MAG: PadR family transcriptional regulator [Phycisphaerales bacterium JB040]